MKISRFANLFVVSRKGSKKSHRGDPVAKIYSVNDILSY